MLPVTFKFSQSSLQDYVDCARRFQLRYVQAQAWPAVVAEPVLEHERHVERGLQFHRLVERHQRGLATERLARGIDDPDLRRWWESYLGFTSLPELAGKRFPEMTLSADVAGVRLVATFDLMVITPDHKLTIVDWKTYLRKPPRAWFEARLQTRLYLYLAARAAQRLVGSAVGPENVSMVYWAAGEPAQPEIFDYDAARMRRDEHELETLIRELQTRPAEAIWPLTPDAGQCRFCKYRSLCGRGEVAGDFRDSNDLDNITISMEESSEKLSLADVEEVGF